LLESSYSEVDLQSELRNILTYLRNTYRSQKTSYSEEDISFLQEVNCILNAVDDFIEIRDDLKEVRSSKQYHELRAKLKRIQKTVAGYAVERRVRKEIRELEENYVHIEEREMAMRNALNHSKISEIEKYAPRCHEGHRMVIRKGAKGFFWGCSFYPNCKRTKKLTETQAESLR